MGISFIQPQQERRQQHPKVVGPKSGKASVCSHRHGQTIWLCHSLFFLINLCLLENMPLPPFEGGVFFCYSMEGNMKRRKRKRRKVWRKKEEIKEKNKYMQQQTNKITECLQSKYLCWGNEINTFSLGGGGGDTDFGKNQTVPYVQYIFPNSPTQWMIRNWNLSIRGEGGVPYKETNSWRHLKLQPKFLKFDVWFTSSGSTELECFLVRL
jgi:hypothetical protein